MLLHCVMIHYAKQSSDESSGGFGNRAAQDVGGSGSIALITLCRATFGPDR